MVQNGGDPPSKVAEIRDSLVDFGGSLCLDQPIDIKSKTKFVKKSLQIGSNASKAWEVTDLKSSKKKLGMIPLVHSPSRQRHTTIMACELLDGLSDARVSPSR